MARSVPVMPPSIRPLIARDFDYANAGAWMERLDELCDKCVSSTTTGVRPVLLHTMERLDSVELRNAGPLFIHRV